MLVSPVQLLRALPPTVRLLVTGTFVNKLGTFIVPYLTLVLRREFGLSGEEVGRLMFAYGSGSLVSILGGGWLTDHLGRRRTLMISLFGSGALALAMGLAPSVRVFVPLLVLFGFLADLYRPASTSIIADLLPSAQRATGFAALRLAVNLGFAFGMALGGLLADRSWRVLFLGDGLTTLLFGLTVYGFIPETRPDAGPSPASNAGSPASPWRDPVYLQMAAISLAFSLVFVSHVTTLPVTITLTGGYPAIAYGVLVGVNGIVIALFELPAVDRLRGFRRLRVSALGLALTGVGFGLTGAAKHWAWYLLTVLVWTAGEILTAPQKMAFIADWAPPEARGRYLSFIQATWSVSMGLNPVLFLPLQARLGDPLFWPLSSLVLLPASLLMLRLDRVADRPELLRGASRPAARELLTAVSSEG